MVPGYYVKGNIIINMDVNMGIKKNEYMNDSRKENAYIVHSYIQGDIF